MFSSLDAIGSALDTGLLVLIWLVQLVIYPAFREIDSERFPSWHKRYSFRVSFVVIPLMFAQLGLSGYRTVSEFGIGETAHLAGCVTAWAITFLFAAKLHRQLGKQGRELDLIDRLIKANAFRTGLWTVTWGLGILLPQTR